MRTAMHGFLFALMLAYPGISGADTRQLFNGKDLSGWRHVGDGSFVVEDGVLHAKGGVGLLWYEGEKIGNAVLRVVYKVKSSTDNSGVFIRIPEAPTNQWMPVDRALEIQINDAEDSGYFRTGSVYTFSKARARPAKVGEWNTMDVTIDGPRTVVHINGVLVSEYREGDPVPPKLHKWDPDRGPRPDSGYIGVQNHPHGTTVYFKEISLRPLKR